MQATSVSAPQVPQPPRPPIPGNIQIPTLPPRPSELDALHAYRDQLAQQLASIELARNGIITEMPAADGPHRGALAQALRELDQQVRVIETELERTERLLAIPQTSRVTTTEPPRSFESPLSPGQATAVSIVFTLFVLFPLAIAAARLIWKRGSIARPSLPPEATKRLDRIEQAVDSIALEVERISEGQRFVNRVLGSGAAAEWPAEGVRQPAEPIAIPRKE